MSGLLVAGNFFIDRLDPQGKSTGIFGPINVTKLAIKTDAETKTRTSNRKATYGQALDDVKIAKPAEISCEFDDQPADLLAMALMGSVVAVNTASGTVTEETKTLQGDQRWLELGHKNLADSGLVVKQGATELIRGSDFEVNFALGMIKALKGGKVEGGGSIVVSYQYNARSGKRINGGMESQIKARIFGEGTNLANGKPIELNIFEASLMPDKEIDFAASEFVSGGLTGTAKLIDGKDAPFVYTELD